MAILYQILTLICLKMCKLFKLNILLYFIFFYFIYKKTLLLNRAYNFDVFNF